MKKAMTIRIPEPCHENWQEMTPTEKGKFCGVCTKEVIDFTAKADEDIIKILSKNTNTCGRFKKSQLNREVKMERKSGIHLAPYAASLLLPLSLLGNTIPNTGKNELPKKEYASLGIGRFSNPERALVNTSGTIMDLYGNPLSNVRITSSETKKTAFSDKNGNYSITALNQEILHFSLKDYESQELKNVAIAAKRDLHLISVAQFEQSVVGKIAPPIEIVEELMGDIVTVEEICEIITSEAIKIKGTVTDEDGLPLPGANIIIKNTDRGTQSDFDGNYSIEADPNAVLIFSYVGFMHKEITLANVSNTINVNMAFDDQVLGGMVVVGYPIDSDREYLPPKLTSEEKAAKKQQREHAYKNEIEFKRIKQERKKGARILKRAQKE